jgi:Protein of unknown function (DUF1194)
MDVTRRCFLQSGLLVGTLGLPSISHAIDPLIELILALDYSGSLYEKTENWITQRDGHVLALGSEDVIELLLSQHTYVKVMMWSGPNEVLTIFKGQMLTRGDINALRANIEAGVPHGRSHSGTTAHFSVLNAVLGESQLSSTRIIDISTDQSPADWSQVQTLLARDALSALGTTVNVLGIDSTGTELLGYDTYLKTPDGFTMPVARWEDYAHTLTQKLIRELQIS